MEHIRQGVEKCKSRGDMMASPLFEGLGVSVKETLLKPFGLFRHRCNYKIDLDNGEWIQVEYSSKRNLLALKGPNRSEVKVTCSDE